MTSLKMRFLGSPQEFYDLPESSAPLRPSEPHEIAYLQYTSGSTRFPRGVMITQKAVLNNLLVICKHGIQVRPQDRAVSWLPYFQREYRQSPHKDPSGMNPLEVDL